MSEYFVNIEDAIKSSIAGLRLTLKHMFAASKSVTNFDVRSNGYFKDASKGLVTLQYPMATLPIPDVGRYKLHNEIDDCIVCDKCAKICPVNCIEIEPVKSTEDIGYTSDGSLKRIYAAKFDIDMAKCCFCGLCTSVCPTECLVMTPQYDFVVSDVDSLNFKFGNLSTDEIAEKKLLLEQKQQKQVPAAPNPVINENTSGEVKPKPVFKPIIKKKD